MAKVMRIPPPAPKEFGPFEVESGSSDPHLGGPLEVRLTSDGGWIRWMGEQKWQRFYWHEVAVYSDSHGEFGKLLEDLRVQAFEEGMSDGVKTEPTPDDQSGDVLRYRAELKSFRDCGGRMDEPLRGA